MTDRIESPRLWARIAGILYLIVFAASIFVLSVNSPIIVSDAAQTAANIVASEQLFRAGFAANLIATAAYIAVVAILYRLFKPAGPTLSVVAAFFGLTGCAVSAAAMSTWLAPLYFLGDAAYLNAIPAEQLQAHARIAWRMSTLGNSIGLVFFGFYCLSLAALVLRARFVPRVLGVFLAFAGLNWLAGNFLNFLAPSLGGGMTDYMIAGGGLGELVFTLWLVIMGVNAERWREQARA